METSEQAHPEDALTARPARSHARRRRALRTAGTLLVVAGVLALVWAVVVWRWQDPFTALYTHYEQRRLSTQLERELREYRPIATPARPQSTEAIRRRVATEAASFGKTLHRGRPVGRLTIGRLGLRVVVVQGTDHSSLKKGPGHYAGSALPGEGRLVYVAGHRTTYGAPFAHIDALRPGDAVRLELPYATFEYVVTRSRIVAATDLSVLRSPPYEVLVLQACHPRFFASHRYLVYARPAAVTPRGGRTIRLG